MLQDQAQCILNDYIRSRYPRQPERFGRFLLSLPMLHVVKPSTVELLFFRETIGEIPIARLLGDMYQMDHHSEGNFLLINFFQIIVKIKKCISVNIDYKQDPDFSMMNLQKATDLKK